ncbi:DivIVA domain-containing protein [Streptomyces sp. NPDC004065]|uniref:DivIVA domain-containing protein n=1 Tax=Streptomyces sp. NPDC004065 TaxID=3364689 RepID=UPI00384F38F9
MNPPHHQAQRRLTPEQVRTKRFTRTPIGRRGLSEEEVGRFMLRVADEIAALHQDVAGLWAENDRLRNFYRDRGERTDGPDGGDARPVLQRQPTVEAVNLLSRAQQQADSLIAQAREYARQVADQARRQYHDVLRQAQQQAQREAERAVLQYRARAGTHYSAEFEELERRLAWARAFLDAIQSVETQLKSAREALAYEVEKLAGAGGPAAPPAVPHAPAHRRPSYTPERIQGPSPERPYTPEAGGPSAITGTGTGTGTSTGTGTGTGTGTR